MSGAVLTTGREVTRELIGAAAYERALASVPPEIAAEYRQATAVSWVPFAVVEPVMEAMAHAANRDTLALQEEVARITMDRSLRSIWRVFLRLTSNEALLSRMPAIYARSYNYGRVIVSFPDRGRAIIELTDWPMAPMHLLRSIRVGIEVTLQAVGRPNARVVLDRTPRGAVFAASGFG
jgi:hypothetical protein